MLLGALAACGAPARRTIRTERAPVPIGPYSQAVLVGDTLWAAGQIGLDPASGALVAGGIQAETRQALRNLGAVLDEAGFSFADVVMAHVYLSDLTEFAAMNEVYAEFLGASAPARATVGVVVPKGARVEIALTAVRTR
jgi:2-iminobutanoate/2-iminopropanoate deaminase